MQRLPYFVREDKTRYLVKCEGTKYGSVGERGVLCSQSGQKCMRLLKERKGVYGKRGSWQKVASGDK